MFLTLNPSKNMTNYIFCNAVVLAAAKTKSAFVAAAVTDRNIDCVGVIDKNE